MRPVHAHHGVRPPKRSSRKRISGQQLVAHSALITHARIVNCRRSKWLSVIKSLAATGLLSVSVSGVLVAAAKPAKGVFQLYSTAFRAGGSIPQRYTCSSDNVSPALSWAEIPAGTQSLVLILSDPDAPSGTWIHWLVYDLPANARHLPEGLPKNGDIEGGGRQGTNSFQDVGYGGPCPPPGDAHHYHFTLYALNIRIGLEAAASRAQVDRAMQGHIIGKADLVGLYKR
jgi:Raf kinase inhibitor-like YbhB/YbcL family protein